MVAEYEKKSIEIQCIIIFYFVASIIVVSNFISVANLFFSSNELDWSVKSIGGLGYIFLWGPLIETVLMVALLELLKYIKKFYIHIVVFACFLVSIIHAEQARSINDKVIYFLAVFIAFAGYAAIYVNLRKKYGVFFVGGASFFAHSLCNVLAVFVWFVFMCYVDR
jgi:hypothetical protein